MRPIEILTVECLRCGDTRVVESVPFLRVGECGRCGYLGWARTNELSESLRRLLRERPPEHRRRLRVA